jgi:hypothetical protein
VTRNILSGVAAAALMTLLAAPEAHAATFAYKFYGGTDGYSGVFNGAGTVYDQTKSLAIETPQAGSSADLKSDADTVAATIVVGGGSRPTITATSPDGNLAWIDAAPSFGGLGVGNPASIQSPQNFGDDQINGTEILRLQFGSVVTLTGIATLFSTGHCCFGAFNLDTNKVQASNIFQIAVGNGDFQNVTFGDANNGLLLALNLTGDVFRFRQVTGQPEFYISALTAVPIPGAAALFVTGLAGVGYLGSRRRATTAA